MESKPIKPQSAGPIEATVGQNPPVEAAREQKPAESLPVSSAPQKTVRQHIFQTALSGLEKEILRKFFNLPGKSEISLDKAQSYAPSLQSQVPNDEVQNVSSIESQLLGLLNSQIMEEKGNTEVKLAAKILSSLLSTKKESLPSSTEDPRLVLLKLLDKINSEKTGSESPVSNTTVAIKDQSALSPEERSTLLQSILSGNHAEDLLLENFITRRNEIINAKREILSLLEKLSLPAVQNPALTDTEPTVLADLIPDYLNLLIKQSLQDLENIGQQTTDHSLRLIFANTKTVQSIKLTSSASENNSLRQLIPALLVDSLVNDLLQMHVQESGNNLIHTSTNEVSRQLKDFLKLILIKQQDNPEKPSVIVTREPGSANGNNLNYLELNPDLVLKDLLAKTANKEESVSENANLTQISAKMLRQSSSINTLVAKLEQTLLTLSNGTQIDLSDLTLNSLNLAIEIKSPELFRASTQFLRSALTNKDIISSLGILLMPVLNLLSESLDQGESQARIELKNLIEQLDNLRNPVLKSTLKRKESLSLILDRVSKFIEENSANNQNISSSSYEKKFLDILGKETLNRLNILAEKIAQPNIALFNLPSPLQNIGLELCSHPQTKKVSEENDSEQNSQKYPAGAERIECSMLLPNLGECGVAITIWENQIHLNICNQNQLVLDAARPLVSQLEKRLEDMNFELPRIELTCATPKAVKPEWLLELLAK